MSEFKDKLIELEKSQDKLLEALDDLKETSENIVTLMKESLERKQKTIAMLDKLHDKVDSLEIKPFKKRSN